MKFKDKAIQLPCGCIKRTNKIVARRNCVYVPKMLEILQQTVITCEHFVWVGWETTINVEHQQTLSETATNTTKRIPLKVLHTFVVLNSFQIENYVSPHVLRLADGRVAFLSVPPSSYAYTKAKVALTGSIHLFFGTQQYCSNILYVYVWYGVGKQTQPAYTITTTTKKAKFTKNKIVRCVSKHTTLMLVYMHKSFWFTLSLVLFILQMNWYVYCCCCCCCFPSGM